ASLFMLSLLPTTHFSSLRFCVRSSLLSFFFFFFNDTAPTEIYTLSLHDALPICASSRESLSRCSAHPVRERAPCCNWLPASTSRSEEHTSELQSRRDLVCRLLLEKKKNKTKAIRKQERSRTKNVISFF